MIQIQHLTQVYSSKKGIFDLSFDVKQGEIFGYIGPNGAGKTTTIRHILGFSNADQGQVTIHGKDARKERHLLHQSIGYLPGEIAFFDHMTGKEFLRFLSVIRGYKEAPRLHELVELFQLETKFAIRKMSKGMKQKLAIVAAMMHDPDILILDEPTSGLDPLMQLTFLDLILAEKERGKTILMSSHIFEEVDRVCDRAAIIKDGRIVAIEDLSTLRSQVQDQLLVTTKEELSESQFEGLDMVQLSSDLYRVTVHQNLPEVLGILSKLPVTSLRPVNNSIEDKFLHYYKGDQHE